MRMSLNLDPAFLLSSRAYGLKRENAIWVKRIVAGVWSEREKRHFGSKELSRAYGLKRENAIWVKRIVAGIWSEREKRYLGQKNCRRHMV